MASANQVALDEGRIDYNQFESMAAHKFKAHDNWEDLNPNDDYTGYDIIKVYPVIGFSTKDGREITSTKGFAKYMMASLGITDFDTSVVDDDPGATGVSFVYQDLGFTWMWDDYDPSQMMDQMIYYTFSGCFGGKVSPLAKYCEGYHQMYE